MMILLDTNFLLIPFKKKLDIYEELRFRFPLYNLITLESCIRELEKMNQKGAIELAKSSGLKIIKYGKGIADSDIISFAKKKKVIVATIDKKLQKKLLEMGVRIIYLREGRFPEIKGKPLKNL